HSSDADKRADVPTPPPFETLWREARELEEREQQEAEPSALDDALAAWAGILSHPHFPTAPPPFRSAALQAAARGYFRRGEALGELADLDRAVACWRQALALIPEGSQEQATLLFNVGVGLEERYAHTREIENLDGAVRAYEAAVALTL